MHAWDDEDPSLLGKVVLVQVTFLDKEHKVKEERSHWGRIIAFNPADGLKVDLEGSGEVKSFPALPEALRRAVPGHYSVGDRDEVLENPEYLYLIASHQEGEREY